jgi:hypothetical protein
LAHRISLFIRILDKRQLRLRIAIHHGWAVVSASRLLELDGGF